MFLKRCTRRKNSKKHAYWQLVESYRTSRGPRHRVVAYLGELDAGERRGWGRLALQLTDVEAVFRTGKSDLKIRPIWHQLEHRVQGHILFSFLAYALWKTLQIWMEHSGLGRGVKTIMEEFARLKSNDVILKTSAGREIKLCCITQPDPALRILLDRMGLTIPERLGRPSWVRKPGNSNEM